MSVTVACWATLEHCRHAKTPCATRPHLSSTTTVIVIQVRSIKNATLVWAPLWACRQQLEQDLGSPDGSFNSPGLASARGGDGPKSEVALPADPGLICSQENVERLFGLESLAEANWYYFDQHDSIQVPLPSLLCIRSATLCGCSAKTHRAGRAG